MLKIKPLTSAEKEVLRLISEEFLTPKQIQYRRQCTRQAINKIINSLKKKGAINLSLKSVDKSEAVVNHVNQSFIRLHGQEFNIKILWQDFHYQSMLKKSNILFLDSHTIKLYRNSIEVYGAEGTNFYGDTPQEAFSKSLAYWKRLFAKLEHNLRVILVKPRSRNIKLVNQHFARGNSEIYNNALENHHRIKIFAKEDGKLAFLTDDSLGFAEDETVHPTTAKPDREEIDKHLNDWRLNHPPTNSELRTLISEVSEKQIELAQVLNQISNNTIRITKILKDLQDK